MPLQPAALRRCASCQRWSGARAPGGEPLSVSIESEQASGLCIDGPWNGSERRARSACGKWTLWLRLESGAVAPGAGPAAGGTTPGQGG